MEHLQNLWVQVVLIVILELLCAAGIYFVKADLFSTIAIIVMMIIHIAMLVWVAFHLLKSAKKEKEKNDLDLSRVLGHDVKEALDVAKMGIISYDEQYNITWLSEFMSARKASLLGRKVSTFDARLNDLMTGKLDSLSIRDGDYIYEVTKKDQGRVLFVKDITRFANISRRFKEDGLVLGLLQLDNYMEVQQYEDEGRMAQINTGLRQPVIDWAKRYGMLIRRLRSDRFLVVLNERIFEMIKKDKFSILSQIRHSAEAMDVSITLSMSFAHGSDDFQELDMMVNDLLELAQSRGGDQVAIKKSKENVTFFGGNSESKEKRSKVRARVISQALKETIQKANRVFIVGHREMDFDCMGSALCMSSFASYLGRDAYIVIGHSGYESQLAEAIAQNETELNARHHFLSDEEARAMLQEHDVLVVVDHNNPQQTSAPLTLEAANKIVVIDHHRRGEAFIKNTLLVYVETGASSTCELLSEFAQYQGHVGMIGELEATLMYAGILVDTNRFRQRSGMRTFEAAAYLKKAGADSVMADTMLKEDFAEFEAKTNIMKTSYRLAHNMVIAPVDDEKITTRTLMSQAADSLLEIKGVDASFVIARMSEKEVAISARSKGQVNVQLILEKMNGGGHFSAAGLQRANTSVQALKEELEKCIEQYLEENKEE